MEKKKERRLDSVKEQTRNVKLTKDVYVVLVVAISSLAGISGECLIIHSQPAHFCLCVCVCVKWRLPRAPQFHYSGQDQSIVAQRAEMTIAVCFLTTLRQSNWQRFRILLSRVTVSRQ